MPSIVRDLDDNEATIMLCLFSHPFSFQCAVKGNFIHFVASIDDSIWLRVILIPVILVEQFNGTMLFIGIIYGNYCFLPII